MHQLAPDLNAALFLTCGCATGLWDILWSLSTTDKYRGYFTAISADIVSMPILTCAHGSSVLENSRLEKLNMSKFPKSYGYNREESFMSLALRLDEEQSHSLAQREDSPAKKHPNTRAGRRTRQAGLCSTTRATDPSCGLQSDMKATKSRTDKTPNSKKHNTRCMFPKQQQSNPITRTCNGSWCETGSREMENGSSSHSSTTLSDMYLDSKRISCDRDMTANMVKETNRLVRRELQKAKAMVTKETNTIRKYFQNLGQLRSKGVTNLDGQDSPERSESAHSCSENNQGLAGHVNLPTYVHDRDLGVRPASMLLTACSRDWNNETVPCSKQWPYSRRDAGRNTHFKSNFDSSTLDGLLNERFGKERDKYNNNAERHRAGVDHSKDAAVIRSTPLSFDGGYMGQRLHSSLMCEGSKFAMSNSDVVGRLASSSCRQDGVTASSYVAQRDKMAKCGIRGGWGDQNASYSGSRGRGASSRREDVSPVSTEDFMKTVYFNVWSADGESPQSGSGKPAFE